MAIYYLQVVRLKISSMFWTFNNQEKALVEAFSMIVQLRRLIVCSTDCDSMLVLVYCHCATFGWEPEFPQMTMETFTKFYFIYICIKQPSPLIQESFQTVDTLTIRTVLTKDKLPISD